MRRVILLFLFAVSFSCIYSQVLRGTTGLLHAPTAVMEKDKTFKIGGNILALTPLHYADFGREVNKTYNYYLNVTLFPWLEVGYICTLNYAKHGSHYFPPKSWGKYTNQDRAFSVRLRAWKEGWWRPWTPQIVFGADDATSHVSYGGGDVEFGSGMNNYFTRFYFATTKHFDLIGSGQLGAHFGFCMGRGVWDEHYNRPSAGVNFRLGLPEDKSWTKLVNGLNLMAEYDARTINVGGEYSLPLSYKKNGDEALSLHAIAELNDGKYMSGGIQLKVHLK